MVRNFVPDAPAASDITRSLLGGHRAGPVTLTCRNTRFDGERHREPPLEAGAAADIRGRVLFGCGSHGASGTPGLLPTGSSEMGPFPSLAPRVSRSKSEGRVQEVQHQPPLLLPGPRLPPTGRSNVTVTHSTGLQLGSPRGKVCVTDTQHGARARPTVAAPEAVGEQ